jgi:hypothetical protein
MNIYEFKKGDKITRIEPTIGVGDSSYIGDCLIFIGIENACIYYCLSNDDKIRMSKLKMVEWKDGWSYYKDPNNLIDDKLLELIDDKKIEKYLRKKKLKNLS